MLAVVAKELRIQIGRLNKVTNTLLGLLSSSSLAANDAEAGRPEQRTRSRPNVKTEAWQTHFPIFNKILQPKPRF